MRVKIMKVTIGDDTEYWVCDHLGEKYGDVQFWFPNLPQAIRAKKRILKQDKENNNGRK